MNVKRRGSGVVRLAGAIVEVDGPALQSLLKIGALQLRVSAKQVIAVWIESNGSMTPRTVSRIPRMQAARSSDWGPT